MKKNNNIIMAYALGSIMADNNFDERDHGRKSIKLGEINKEWENYEVVHHYYNKTNGNYAVYFDGTFGKNFYVRIIDICDAFEIEHVIAQLIGSIEMHKAEMKKVKKEDLTI